MTDQSSTPAAPSGPIADLSYRSYDGPLKAHIVRWWVLARSTMRVTARKKEYWILLALSGLPYVFTAFLLYMVSRLPAMGPNPFIDATPGQRYAYLFDQALGWQAIWVFALTLVVGSGAVSADNQANALMVYLSKPLSKGDYVAGKWVGMFLMLLLATLAPALVLYLYCALSYRSEGFFTQEPWLFLKMVGAAANMAIIHAGLMLGVSAWSKTPRMAGASYAALYFATRIAADIYWGFHFNGNQALGYLEHNLSLPGVIRALDQNIFGVTVHSMVMHRHSMAAQIVLPPPDLHVFVPIAIAIVAAGLLAARLRIRAVEVIRG